MSARALRILGRFPAHLGATRAGTQLLDVVEALGAQLEVFSADLASVRRAHRIGHAETLADVLKLAALHGIGPADLAIASVRRQAALALVTALEAAAAPEARDATAEALLDLWGIDLPAPRLALFAPARAPGAAPDLTAAATRLAAKLRSELRSRRHVEAVRARVVRIAQLHARGNGTVRTLLEAAANALDQELDTAGNAAVKAQLVALGRAGTLELAVGDEIFHSKDLFWHSSCVRDRAPLVRTVPALAPAQLVRMNERIVASELADQMRLRFDQLAPTLVTLGLSDLGPTSSLDQDTATVVAGALGFTVERFPRAVAAIGASTTVAQLAVLLGQGSAALLQHLASLGLAGLTPASLLAPEDSARAARRYGFVVQQTLPVRPELIGMEENPLRREDFRNEECEHGHRFSVVRKGFGREPLQARVKGRANRTVGPMVVNRDEGKGVGWFGAVPDGATLVFQEDGRALLEGEDVTERAYSWSGACFGDALHPSTRDFVFGGALEDPLRRARFALANPAGALDREFAFPHAGENIDMPGVGIGETRMAFFVQQAHLGSRDAPGVLRAFTPRPFIAYADASVFAPVPAAARPAGDTHPDSDYVAPVAADLVLSWLEHEAYALRVIVPKRFALLDAPPGASPPAAPGTPAPTRVSDRVAAALERFRPAGVQIRVEYLDDAWVLDEGSITDQAGGPIDPNLVLRGGTVLSPAPGDGT